MHIDSSQAIASIPILTVRDFLRKNDSFSLEDIREGLRLSWPSTKELLEELLEKGWAIPSARDKRFYEKTPAGQRLCAGSASRPLTRKYAQGLLESAISRAGLVNSNPEYAYYVKTIRLYGSMLSDKDRPSDVDLAVELVPRYEGDTFEEVLMERERHSPYRDFMRAICWPEDEIYRMLKQRSRGLSIQPWGDLEKLLNGAPQEVVFNASIVSRNALRASPASRRSKPNVTRVKREVAMVQAEMTKVER